jgi:hypothetical protein
LQQRAEHNLRSFLRPCLNQDAGNTGVSETRDRRLLGQNSRATITGGLATKKQVHWGGVYAVKPGLEQAMEALPADAPKGA